MIYGRNFPDIHLLHFHVFSIAWWTPYELQGIKYKDYYT